MTNTDARKCSSELEGEPCERDAEPYEEYCIRCNYLQEQIDYERRDMDWDPMILEDL